MTGLPDTFWSKTRQTDCIIWVAATNSRGYGCFAVDGVSQLAHRLAYIDAYGPIPDGLVIDHLCKVHNCVNPEHLEAVTESENQRRGKGLRIGDTCGRGHDITGEDDIYSAPRGTRECRACRRIHVANAKAKARAS